MIKHKYRSALMAALLAVAGAAASADTAGTAAALERPSMRSGKASSAVALLTATRAGSRVLAAGERGVIIYSDDVGRRWMQAQVPTSATLTAMQFVDARKGWAVGHMGVVLQTTDGGANWTKQFDGLQAAQRTLAFAKLGGDARAIRDAERLVADGADKPFFDLHFLDERTGYIVGAYNLIFRTDDGGSTWRPWQDHVGNSNPKGLHLYGVRAVGGALFIVGEQGLLLRSNDLGDHFEAVKSPYEGSWFGLTGTADAVVVYGLRGNAYRSTDRGQRWERLPTETQVSIAAGLHLLDGRLVLVSQAGDVLASGDGGASFKHLPGAAGLPLAAAAEVPGGLVIASLRGVRAIALPKP